MKAYTEAERAELIERCSAAVNVTSDLWRRCLALGEDFAAARYEAELLWQEIALADAVASLMDGVNPHHILAIAEAFQALEQRAEAAEATIKQQDELILSYQETIRQQTEKLAEEKRINSKLREDRAGLSRECNAFEAKLDELAKQEAVAFVNAPRKAKMLYAGERLPVDTNLYARPAPAVSLAELVPDKKSTDIDYAYYPLTKARHEGYNECVDDILRNIEESKK